MDSPRTLERQDELGGIFAACLTTYGRLPEVEKEKERNHGHISKVSRVRSASNDSDMWLVTGPFDGEVSGEVDFKKTKLLKTGKKYGVGRKERPLLINHKKVSHEHAEFVVGPYLQEDLSNPQIIPKLEFCNIKNKPTTLKRGDDLMVINPSATQELQDGDIIILVIGVPITVQWLPLCCYMPVMRGKPSVSTEACAHLGISIVYNPNPHMTHHTTSTYAVTASIAYSLLLAAQLVKSEWLIEVIRLGNLPTNNDPSDGISLEQMFALPLVTKFRPSFSPALPSSLKVFKVWDPNEERFNMFKGHRFICVDEKPNGELREMIRRGGGEFEAFTVGGGKQKMHHALSKAKRVTSDAVGSGKKLTLVADEKAMIAAVGPDLWKELLAEAKSFGLRFVAVENILLSVINVHISHIDSTFDGEEDGGRLSSPLPDFVPNTHPDEPSIVPAKPSQEPGAEFSRQLRRRAPTPAVTSRAPSPQVVEDQDHEVEPPRPPRKRLTRRAGKPIVIGIDDQSLNLDIESNTIVTGLPESTAELITLSAAADIAAPVPVRSSRLKRRAGTAASQAIPISDMDEIREEPPLKKFKALFEASDPDRAADGLESYESGMIQQSITQTQTQVRETALLSNANAAGLEVVREEEEESLALGSVTGAKRKAEAVEGGEDVEMGDAPRPSTKKRAVENMNAVEPSGPPTSDPEGARPSKPPSKVKSMKPTKSGAAIGKPDTDAAFLKALASTKRGKKNEDSFDREFNKLKISKPDLGREEQEQEWAVLEDFGDERNIRGNFMVVLEMDVYKKEGQSREGEGRVEWENRPNFKKFKKKVIAGARKMIELVVAEENDYGTGSAYWKGGNSQSQSQVDDFASSQKLTRSRPKLPTQAQTQTQKGKTRAFVVDDSDEEVIQEIAPRKGKTKAPSRAASKRPEAPQPLFLDSDEDPKVPEHDDEQDETLQSSGMPATRRSTRVPTASKSNAKRKVPAAVIVDDDSDDGVTFKGFAAKKKSARR